MNEATVTGLVTDLNLGLTDASRIAQEFQEVCDALARSGIWIEASVMDTLSVGLGLYAFPDNALVLLCAFYDDRQLNDERAMDLDGLGHWRDHRGTPLAYVRDYLADRTFLLYPLPDAPSQPLLFTFGEPLGRDYPSYGVVVLTTFRRTVFQPWLAMLVALKMSALEFRREGRQRDTQYSDACAAVASLAEAYLS